MMPSSARTRRRRSTRSSPSEGIISGATPAEIARARTYLSPTVWNGWPSTSRTQAGTPTSGREDFLVIGNLVVPPRRAGKRRSDEHTSELQSLMRISYAVICLKQKKIINKQYIYI